MRLERLVVGPEDRSRYVVQPRRHAPEVPLGGDEGADAQHEEEPGVLDNPRELHQIEAVLEVVLAGGGLVAVPEDVGLDAVGAALLGLRHQLGPHRGDAAGVVDGGRDEQAAAAGDDEGAVVVRHARGRGRGDHEQLQQQEEQGEQPRTGGGGGHGWSRGESEAWRCAYGAARRWWLK